jgi:hypothetical protein
MKSLVLATAFLLHSCNTFATIDADDNSSSGTHSVDSGTDSGTINDGAVSDDGGAPAPPTLGPWKVVATRAAQFALIRDSDIGLGFDLAAKLDGHPKVFVSLIDGVESAQGPRPVVYQFDLDESATVASPQTSPARFPLPRTWSQQDVVPTHMALALAPGGDRLRIAVATELRPCPDEDVVPSIGVTNLDTVNGVVDELTVRTSPCGRLPASELPLRPNIDILTTPSGEWLLANSYPESGFGQIGIALPFDSALDAVPVEGPEGSSLEHTAAAAGLAALPGSDSEIELWGPELGQSATVNFRDEFGVGSIAFAESDEQPLRYFGLTSFGATFWGAIDCGPSPATNLDCDASGRTIESDPILIDSYDIASVGNNMPAIATYSVSENLDTRWYVARHDNPFHERLEVSMAPQNLIIEQRVAIIGSDTNIWLVLAAVTAPSNTEPNFRHILVRAFRLAEDN